jgi:hypothetical protein
MRSRDYHLIPPAITFSSTLGGRRDVKFYTFIATYSASGPTAFNEGQTGTYNFFTDDSDGTYNFNTTPAERMSPESGTFSVTGGLGTFNLSGFSNAVGDDTANITVEFKNIANDTVLTTIVTELSDTTEVISPNPGTYEVFALSATWLYEDNGTDLGTTWKEVDYNDTAWSSGPARLGFGLDGEVTTLSDTNQITFYFRKDVTILSGALYDEYDLEVIYDDGFVVWVNDNEVARDNLPSAPAFDTLATGTVTNGDLWTQTIPSSAFVEGNNVIAVEVHQVNATSSDVSFDMGLSARELEPWIASGPANVTEGNNSDLYFLSGTQGQADATYYFSVHPTGHFVEEDGSYSITNGVGTFTLSAAPDETTDGDVLVAIDFRETSTAGTILTTLSTTVVDDVGQTAGWVSFQEGVASYAGTTDTYVQSGANEGTNRGSEVTVVTDKNASNERFGLTKFDDISAAFTDHTAVTVTSASLELDITAEGQGMALHTMLLGWTESTTWTSGNGAGTFDGGTGYMLSSLGSWPGNNDYTGPITIDLDNQTVQDWINTPGSNKGMWMIGTHPTDGQQHSSKDATTSTDRPKLTIAYTE